MNTPVYPKPRPGKRARIEQEAEQKKEQAARLEREAQERRDQAEDAVAQGKATLANGTLDEAQTHLQAAQTLDPESDGVKALGAAVKEELHRQALATLPKRLEKIRAFVAKEAWKHAGKECKAAKVIDATYEELSEACAPAVQQLVLLGRVEAVDNALAVAADADKCETPLAISEAWTELKKIPKDDPSFKKAKKAAPKLEKCRKKTERLFDKGLRDIMIAQRERYASNLDTAFLESGIDATVTVGGQHQNRLKIQWVLMGRARAYELANDGGILTAAEKIGFTRVTFTDGYFESFRYDLEPESEAGGGKAVLSEMGLAEPLRL